MQGSLVNRLAEGGADFEVGEGATVCFYSDRCAGTIVARNGRTLTWQADKATRTDDLGMSDAQSYTYERDPQGRTMEFTMRKNGRWVCAGEPMRGGTGLAAGRFHYFDYSF